MPLLRIDDHLHRVAAVGLAVAAMPQGLGKPHQGDDLAAVLDHLPVGRVFDRRARDLLEPGHQGQGDGHPALGAVPQQEIGGPFVLLALPLFPSRLVAGQPLRDRGDDAGVLGNPRHVEDQADMAIAHDRRPREQRGPLELLAQRLDHDLLGVVDPLDDQAEPLAVGLEHDDVHRVVRLDQALEPGQRGHHIERNLADSPHGRLRFDDLAGVMEFDDVFDRGVEVGVDLDQVVEFGTPGELLRTRPVEPATELALLGRDDLIQLDLFLTVQHPRQAGLPAEVYVAQGPEVDRRGTGEVAAGRPAWADAPGLSIRSSLTRGSRLPRNR